MGGGGPQRRECLSRVGSPLGDLEGGERLGGSDQGRPQVALRIGQRADGGQHGERPVRHPGDPPVDQVPRVCDAAERRHLRHRGEGAFRRRHQDALTGVDRVTADRRRDATDVTGHRQDRGDGDRLSSPGAEELGEAVEGPWHVLVSSDGVRLVLALDDREGSLGRARRAVRVRQPQGEVDGPGEVQDGGIHLTQPSRAAEDVARREPLGGCVPRRVRVGAWCWICGT